MPISLKIASVTSSGHETVEFPSAGITCIVGSNNVGKSQTLRDIVGSICEYSIRPTAIQSLAISKSPEPSQEEMDEWLKRWAVPQPGVGSPGTYFTPIQGGQALRAEDIILGWRRPEPSMGPTGNFFVWHASAGSLLNFATGGLGAIAMGTHPHPLARLFSDSTLEVELSKLAETAFGEGLLLDRVNGDVRLRVGKLDGEAPRVDDIKPEYAAAVRDLRPLEAQGDGMKSFIGLALNVVAGHSQVFVVDEPEAFLHPGQSRALGRWLASQAHARNIQIVVATHDRDFILGVLDGGPSGSVNVIRIVRSGDVNHFFQLKPQEVSEVWDNQVLRYSNVLQGLFHRKVVICEGDSDCRFYGAVVDNLAAERGQQSLAGDTLFVPSGGKQRVASLARALNRLGVSASTVVDFDVLRKRADIRGIFEELGGVWSEELNADYVTFAQEANDGDMWDRLKHSGVEGLGATDGYRACRRLLDELEKFNVQVVRVGEMEDFDKLVEGDKSGWVSAMLEKDGHKTCVPARELCAKLLA